MTAPTSPALAAAPRNAVIVASVLVLLGTFCFSVMNAIAKFLPTLNGPEIHVFMLTSARYLIAALIVFPIWIRSPKPRAPTHLHRYAIRTLAGFGGIALMFVAVSKMQLAAATAIGFTSPIFTILIAALLLREGLKGIVVLGTFIGLASTMLIIVPAGFTLSSGAFFAVAAAVCMGGEVAAIKWLSSGRDSSMTIIFFSNLLGAVLSLGLAAPHFTLPQVPQVVLLVSIGAVAVTGQFLILSAARRVPASFLAPFFFVSLVYSTLIGIVVFAEVPSKLTLLGCAGIICGATLITQQNRKWRSARR